MAQAVRELGVPATPVAYFAAALSPLVCTGPVDAMICLATLIRITTSTENKNRAISAPEFDSINGNKENPVTSAPYHEQWRL